MKANELRERPSGLPHPTQENEMLTIYCSRCGTPMIDQLGNTCGLCGKSPYKVTNVDEDQAAHDLMTEPSELEAEREMIERKTAEQPAQSEARFEILYRKGKTALIATTDGSVSFCMYGGNPDHVVGLLNGKDNTTPAPVPQSDSVRISREDAKEALFYARAYQGYYAHDYDNPRQERLDEIAGTADRIEQALASGTDSTDRKELDERLLNLLKAVGHVGVDFGFGEYQLCNEEIEEARNLYAALSQGNDADRGGSND